MTVVPETRRMHEILYLGHYQNTRTFLLLCN